MVAKQKQSVKKKREGTTAVVPEPGRRPKPDKRSTAQEIVGAAYQLIAEKGFEGLRTRDVAAKIGINSATLHYHYPRKEDLVRAVVRYLMAELSTSRVKLREKATAHDRLHAEFLDMQRRIRDSPEQLLVLTELSVRALRDPTVSAMLQHVDRGWHAQLRSIFQQGLEEHTFRPDLDADAAATALQAQLRGLGLLAHSGQQGIERALHGISSATWFASRVAGTALRDQRRARKA